MSKGSFYVAIGSLFAALAGLSANKHEWGHALGCALFSLGVFMQAIGKD